MLTGCEYIVGNFAGEDLMPPSNSYFKIQGFYRGKNIDIETKYPVIDTNNPPLLILAANVERLGYDFKILGFQIDTTGLTAGVTYVYNDNNYLIMGALGDANNDSNTHLFLDEYNSEKITGDFQIQSQFDPVDIVSGEFYIEFDDPY